eukprot:Awhi_evm1s5281
MGQSQSLSTPDLKSGLFSSSSLKRTEDDLSEAEGEVNETQRRPSKTNSLTINFVKKRSNSYSCEKDDGVKKEVERRSSLSSKINKRLSSPDIKLAAVAKGTSDNKMRPIYLASRDYTIDKEVRNLWKRYVRGELESWQAIVREKEKEGETNLEPPRYWLNNFQEMMVNNISTAYPEIAAELNSRSIVCTIQTLTMLMHLVLSAVVNDTVMDEVMVSRIAMYHYKWQVEDSAYITVENAFIGSLRLCFGRDFTPAIENRLRYKYGNVKLSIQAAERKYAKENPEEAKEKRAEGCARLQELKKERLAAEAIERASHCPASTSKEAGANITTIISME